MDTTTRKIVIAGVMGAISALLVATNWGFVPWPTGISLTFMHVPVIVGAILGGPWVGLAIGAVFGTSSLYQATVAPRMPDDVVFTNPLISILPRLFIGPLAWLAYRALRQANERAALTAAGLAGSLTNTTLVLGALAALKFLPWGGIAGIFVLNGIPEAIFAAIITVAVVAAWKRIETGRKGSTV
jgi:uncharacterized membrane protein